MAAVTLPVSGTSGPAAVRRFMATIHVSLAVALAVAAAGGLRTDSRGGSGP